MSTILDKSKIYIARPYATDLKFYTFDEIVANRAEYGDQLGLFLVYPTYRKRKIGPKKFIGFSEINTGKLIIKKVKNEYDDFFLDVDSDDDIGIGDVYWKIDFHNAIKIIGPEKVEKYKNITNEEIIKRLEKVHKKALELGKEQYNRLVIYQDGSLEVKDYISDDDSDLLNVHTTIMRQFNNMLNQIDKSKLPNKKELFVKVELAMQKYIDRYTQISNNNDPLKIDTIVKLDLDTLKEDIVNLEAEIMSIKAKQGQLGNVLEENEVLKQKISEMKEKLATKKTK